MNTEHAKFGVKVGEVTLAPHITTWRHNIEDRGLNPEQNTSVKSELLGGGI